MVERIEQQRRGQSSRKTSTTHPYIAIEHRVLDSESFADLKHSSVRVLLAIARQLSKDNNGHLQATWTWCKRYGIGSDNTLTDAIADLIAHGFIYRTKSHGANGVWATYAVTWVPIKKTDGLFLAGLKMFAYRDWQPGDKKTSPQKLREHPRRKCGLSGDFPAETAVSLTSKTACYEYMLPCSSTETALSTEGHAGKYRAASYASPYLIRRQVTADRGQLRVVH